MIAAPVRPSRTPLKDGFPGGVSYGKRGLSRGEVLFSVIWSCVRSCCKCIYMVTHNESYVVGSLMDFVWLEKLSCL